MGDALRAAIRAAVIRPEIDLDASAGPFCRSMLHVGLDLFDRAGDPATIAALRCETFFDGVATTGTDDLDGSEAMAAARAVIASWDGETDPADERSQLLRAVARTEFARRGYRATTVREIVAAAGLHGTDVFRRFGSKENLTVAITDRYSAKVAPGWRAVLRTDAPASAKLAALITVDVHLIARYREEFRVLQAWLRESPPASRAGWAYDDRLRDLQRLVREGTRAGDLRVPGPNVGLRTQALADLLFLPESVLDDAGGADRASRFLVELTLHGLAARS
jgi:AcrR family transcriptional regulator